MSATNQSSYPRAEALPIISAYPTRTTWAASGDGALDVPTGQRRPPLPLVRDEKVIETLKPADQDRLTQRYTDEAVKFIRAHKDKQFFLYLAHTAVHVPLHPGKDFRGKSANGTYGDWVEEGDGSAGRVLDVLRELHLDKNTLVIFTSDNGPWLIQGKDGGTAGPLRGGKGGTFEGGVREPTIAWWPGRVPAGGLSDAVVANIDLLPTFVKLAGGKFPTTARSTVRTSLRCCWARPRIRLAKRTTTSTATGLRPSAVARGSLPSRRRAKTPASRRNRTRSPSRRSSITSTPTSAKRPMSPPSIPRS